MYLKNIISFIITFCILTYLFYFIDWNVLLSNASNTNLKIIFCGIFCFIFYPIIVALRWKTLLLKNNFYSTFRECFHASLHSFLINLFAPAKSGDFIKVLSMKKITDKSKLFSIIISERMGDVIVLSGLIFLTNIYYSNVWELVFGMLILLTILFFIYIVQYIRFRFKNTKLLEIQETIFRGVDAWRQTPLKLLHASCFSLINWILAGFQVWLFFLGFGIDISYLTVISIFPITVLISIIPLTPSGIGIREASFMFFFSNFASYEICLVVSMLYFISSTALNSILGSFFIKYLFKN